jgi:hypothetical protein
MRPVIVPLVGLLDDLDRLDVAAGLTDGSQRASEPAG